MAKDPEVLVRKDAIVQEGFLYKESRLLKVWRRRWCVLTPEYLCTFRGEGNYRNPTEIIRLDEVTSANVTGKEGAEDMGGMENCLHITTASRGFFLVASSAIEKKAWMSAIVNCCLPCLVLGGICPNLQLFAITEDEDEVELEEFSSDIRVRTPKLADVLKPRITSSHVMGCLPDWLRLLAEIFKDPPKDAPKDPPETRSLGGRTIVA